MTTAEELDRAVHTARPGDLILIAPGRYPAKLRFSEKNTGTQSAPITLTARDGPGTVVIEGFNTAITIKFNATAHIRLEALDITGGGNHGVLIENGAHNIVVHRNRIYDNHRQRPMNSHAELKGSGGKKRPRLITITRNEIFHTEHPPGSNFQGIDCNFCDDFLIADNYLHDIRNPNAERFSHYDRGSCIQMKSTSRNAVVARNRIARCHIGIVYGGEGLASPEHIGGAVRNNVVHDSGEIGIAIVNVAGGRVVHNTLFGNGESIRIARDTRFRDSENNVEIANNILGGPIRILEKPSGTIRGNHILEAGTPEAFFANLAARDFRLKATASPLIDQAEDLPNALDRDFDGKPRPYGPRADIGAFEYQPGN